MKPTRGYVIAEIIEKKRESGIILADDNNVANKQIVVKWVHKEEKEIKKGDEVVLANVQNLMGVKGTDEKDYIVISTSDICAIR